MTTLVQLKHGYDQAGNRLYRRDEVARTNSASFDELYGYDDLNRLTSFDRGQLGSGNTSLSSGPTLNQGWTLDPLGNWSGFQQTVQEALTQTRAHNTTNEITDIDKTVGVDWSVPGYDANGNTVRWPRPSSGEDEDLGVYDAWNRLVKIERGSTVAEYQYDGLNRRIIKEASSVTRHYYHSDRWQVLEERTGSNTTADRQYLWGQQYVDDLIFRDHSSTRLYALTDALFNVVALTDDDGAVVERFAYQPYGQSEELDPDFTTYSGTNYQWEYRFTGRELDLDSGLQLNRNRYLHLQLGRWMTRDPIGYDGGADLYQYVSGAPFTYIDPSGLDRAVCRYKYFPHSYIKVIVNGQCWKLDYSIVGYTAIECPPGDGWGEGIIWEYIESDEWADIALLEYYAKPDPELLFYFPIIHDCNAVTQLSKRIGIDDSTPPYNGEDKICVGPWCTVHDERRRREQVNYQDLNDFFTRPRPPRLDLQNLSEEDLEKLRLILR